MRSAGKGAPKKKLATARQKPNAYSAPARQAADASRVRMQIVDLITANAVALVEATIQEAMHGHYPAMKCLLEIAGLADPKPFEQGPDNEGLAQILLRQLGLPGETVLGNDTTGEKHMGAFRGIGSLPLP
ncbi:MAG: hypothetical protein JST79_10525 [Acidobacteria bacterium]|jgi:hypothetical protein|nr:hypothetical protein [Acidobacteriota bacterium]